MARLSIAFAAFLTSIALAAQSPRYLELVDSAQSAIDTQNWNRADSLLVAAMKLEPGSPGNILLMSNLGIVRFQAGDFNNALETLNQAARMAPNAVVVLSNRARLLSALGRDDEAAADYTHILEVDSTDTSALFNRGMLALNRGDVAAATPDFDKLASLQPDSRETHIAMASSLARRGDFDQARRHYTALLESEPNDEFYLGRAICNLMTDRLSEAAIDLNEAIKINPDNPDLYAQRAVLHRMTYRNAEAEADLRKAFSLGYQLDISRSNRRGGSSGENTMNTK